MAKKCDRIRLLAPSLVSRDAIGIDTMRMQAALRSLGYRVEVFAGSREDHLRESTKSLSRPDRAWLYPDTLTIYQLSTSWKMGAELIRQIPNPVILRYHCVTPPELMDRYPGVTRSECVDALKEAEELCRLPNVRIWASSRFNADEIRKLGARADQCHVLPPFHRVSDLVDGNQSCDVTDCSLRELVLLFTGALKPHKGHDLLIRALSCLRVSCQVPARLVLVGKRIEEYDAYVRYLERLARRLGVHECLELTGDISDGELASWYRRADVFVCGSLHEGFCVPLVEAMAFGVPIVSTAAGACAETIGDAGLVFEERDPWVLAEAIYHLWAHPTDRTLLQQQGCARYEALYSQECLEKQLSALMAKLA